MRITVQIDGRDQILEVPDDASPEEIDEIVNAEAGGAADAQGGWIQTLGNIAGMISKGATLGFADEISGAADAILSKVRGDDTPFRELYRQRQQMYDRATDQFAEEHPVAAGALEAVGATIPTAAAVMSGNPALLGQQVGRTAAGRIGHAAGVGAGTGALAGYGDADPGDEIAGAAMGAAIGGVVGTGAGAATETGSAIATRLREPTQQILSYIESLGGAPRPPMARQAAPAPSRPTTAQEKVLQALERDQVTPAEVSDRLRAQQDLGKPAGIIDVAGDNTRGLGRATVTLPGRGRQTATARLDERSDAQLPRVLQDVEQGVGVSAQDTDALAREIIERRSAAARPAYQRAYAQGEITAPDVIEVMDQNPAFVQAHQKARQLLAGANRQVPELFNPENGQLIRWPTVEDVDLIKKGLDRRLYNNRRGVNDPDEPALDKYFAGLLEGQRARLLQAVDEAVPAYAEARAGFAGETAMYEALEAGREFLKMDPRQAARAISDLTPDQQEMFRIGAVDAIRRRLMSAADNADHANVVKSIFGYGKGGKRDLLATIFRTPEELARFEQQMASEIQMHQTRQFVTGGSQTANKLAEIEDASRPVEDALVDVAGGNIKGGVMRLGRTAVHAVTDRMRAGATERTRSEVADEIFNFTEADQAQEFLRQLEQIRLQRIEANRTKRAIGTGASTFGTVLATQ